MATAPSHTRSSALNQLTADTASRRPSSNPTAFMTAYAWWTAKITGTHCPEGEPLPLDDVSLAAQVEAYAAARRRDAYTHPKSCACDACAIGIRREVPLAHLKAA